MDLWIADYLSGNPDALVVDLGCGFDSRVLRVDPPAGHHWYDVDFPDVIEIADQLYPDRAEHSTIGASVVEPGWLAEIPADRPAIVVADGLLNFLAEDDVRQVLRQIVDHFPRGEVCFNITSSVVKRQREKRPVALFTKFGITEQWWLDDVRGAEKLDERLHFVEQKGLMDKHALAHAPRYYRALGALIRAVPSWNNSGWILRYRF